MAEPAGKIAVQPGEATLEKFVNDSATPLLMARDAETNEQARKILSAQASLARTTGVR